MTVETDAGPIFTIEEVLAGKHRTLTPQQVERRRRAIVHSDELTHGMRLPRGYVQELIRSGRDDPEGDNEPRSGEPG